MPQIFSGLPAAPGVGIGNLYIYVPLPMEADESDAGEYHRPDREWQRFLATQKQVDEELMRFSQTANPLVADIFMVHREILHDATLTEAIHTAIENGANAATAIQQATSELVRIFQSLSDSYFASRSADIRDVGQRLLAHLEGTLLVRQMASLPCDTILVADDLTPYDASHLPTNSVTGIALAGSTPTAHTAILARSLGLPVVCGLGQAILQLPTGRQAIVDGVQGQLLVEPTQDLINRYQDTQKRIHLFRTSAESKAHEPAVTADGQKICVSANINHSSEVKEAVAAHAEGVGLLRTEYLFEDRTDSPSTTEQLNAYRSIACKFSGHTITIRLLDIGGDKPVGYLPQPLETNPFLGVRGIRLLFQQELLLQQQLEALVQLAQEETGVKHVRILVPMVSQLSEVEKLLAYFERIPGAQEARMQQCLEIGIMIEIPAAALLADKLAPLVNFFSIGTNDLAQYTLAADRVNSEVAALASPLDPAVLRLIDLTCKAAHGAGIPVAVCGEIASDPAAAPLLMGLGVTELSVTPPAVAVVKQAVRHSDMTQNRQLAEQALRCTRAEEVVQLLGVE